MKSTLTGPVLPPFDHQLAGEIPPHVASSNWPSRTCSTLVPPNLFAGTIQVEVQCSSTFSKATRSGMQMLTPAFQEADIMPKLSQKPKRVFIGVDLHYSK